MDFAESPRKARWVPLALSLALHALLVLAWRGFPLPAPRSDDEPAMAVEIAPEPALPRTPPAPDAKAAPQPSAETKPIPQLEEGLLAQRSTPPVAKPAQASPTPRAETAITPKTAEPVAQSERDFVLSQVLRHWHPPRELAAYERAEMSVAVVVDALGHFDGEYDSRRPWNPAAVFDGYGALHPQSVQRRAIDAFYQAIRKAQPVRLPPALKAKAPFSVRLDFRFKDVR